MNGREDSIVTEMIKQLPQDKSRDQKVLSTPLDGTGRSTQFSEDCDIGIPPQARCRARKRDNKLEGRRLHVSDVEVLCDLFHSSIGKEKGILRDGQCCKWEALTESAVNISKS